MNDPESLSVESPLTSVGQVVISLFHAFHEKDIKYCVLRNYDRLPNDVGNDLDVLVDVRSKAQANRCLLFAAKESGWLLIRCCIRRGVNSYYFAKKQAELLFMKFVFMHVRSQT